MEFGMAAPMGEYPLVNGHDVSRGSLAQALHQRSSLAGSRGEGAAWTDGLGLACRDRQSGARSERSPGYLTGDMSFDHVLGPP